MTSRGARLRAAVGKALQPRAEWEEKDDFLDVLYWQRQGIAVVCGIAWGILGLQNLIAILTYGGLSSAVVYWYSCAFQDVVVDDYGGAFNLLTEGFKEALALFLVVWILIFSAVHAEDY